MRHTSFFFGSFNLLIERLATNLSHHSKKWFSVVLMIFTILCFSQNGISQKVKQKVVHEIKQKSEHEKSFFKRLFSISKKEKEGEEENDMYDGAAAAAKFEYNKTKDPATGKVPRERLLVALNNTILLERNNVAKGNPQAKFTLPPLSWTERGPYTDLVGSSNGNTRANSAITAGRVRAIMVDSLDAAHKTVWAGGVDGGLWKTNDITAAPANWILVNDFLSNIAVSDICQDPTNGNIMYFCTGESYYNGDAVSGVGVFKSTNHGLTWNFLPSTSAFTQGTRILCDNAGNIYLATRGTGLLRSTKASGGAAWTNITPSSAPNADICDLELSSTGRLHMVTGIFTQQAYRYTDIPSTCTSAAGWNSPATAFPSFFMRAEIAVSGNVLYAAPANASYQVPTMYKSIDGGANWTSIPSPGGGGWANGQGWYSLSVRINPANSNQVIVGGLDNYKTTDGGASWSQISVWVGFSTQYVHADQHNLMWWDGGTKMLFACDGGVHYSADGGTTIRDRNEGLRIKQFYSVAAHPTATNYFLAGAQDNGTHQLTMPGLSNSTEVTGGDGAFVAIDQDQPQFQFGSYVYNNYRRSINGGANWGSVNFGNVGQFINPYDYDNTNNKIYAGYSSGQYLRWNDPQTGSSASGVSIPSFNSMPVTAVAVSPYTSNRVFFGVSGSTPRIVRVDGADAAPVDANITMAGTTSNTYVSCINTGTNDQNLMACFANYGIDNIYVSTNGGTSWTACDGNLPDMPVRWCMYYPGDNTRAYIATETGVWETDKLNGASTIWVSNATFPSVRTDMIKYRPSDRTIVAATHGRGVWTATVPPNKFDWVNLQWPPTLNTCFGNSFTAYGQAFIAGVTEASGPGAGIVAEFGINTANTNPNTWTNWIPATFNSFASSGNNDEYFETTGTTLTAGSYFYTFRYSVNGSNFQYGGFNASGGGFWDGTTNVSGALTVNPKPIVSFSGLAASYNVSAASATLTGTPTGGTFSGLGISGNMFSPSTAGVGGPYNITYQFTNAAGCTDSSTQQTTVTNNCTTTGIPSGISTVGGAASMCPGSSKTYKIAAVTGATSYTWTPPIGATIATGQGTTIVSVNYNSGFTASDTLRVVANNDCGASSQRKLFIRRNTPTLPSAIVGQAYGVCKSSNVPYSVTNVAGINYSWTFNSLNASVVSGQGTNAITANFVSGYVTGILSVLASNGCGTTAARTATIKATPAIPASVSGATSVCANQFGVPYSITSLLGATAYVWTGPTGSHVSDGVKTSIGAALSTTSTSVTVNYGPTAGNLLVRGTNSCGGGSSKTVPITFNCLQRDSKTGDFKGGLEIVISPNPSNSFFTLVAHSSSKEAISMKVVDANGRIVYKYSGNVEHSYRFGENFSNGLYLIEVSQGDMMKTLKAVKVK